MPWREAIIWILWFCAGFLLCAFCSNIGSLVNDWLISRGPVGYHLFNIWHSHVSCAKVPLFVAFVAISALAAGLGGRPVALPLVLGAFTQSLLLVLLWWGPELTVGYVIGFLPCDRHACYYVALSIWQGVTLYSACAWAAGLGQAISSTRSVFRQLALGIGLVFASACIPMLQYWLESSVMPRQWPVLVSQTAFAVACFFAIGRIGGRPTS